MTESTEKEQKFIWWFQKVEKYQTKTIKVKNELQKANEQIIELSKHIKLKATEIAEQTNQLKKLKAMLNGANTKILYQADDIKGLNLGLNDKLNEKDTKIADQTEKINSRTERQFEQTESLADSNNSKRYTCPDCKEYKNDVMAKIRAHQSHGCKALKNLKINDHQCPLCSYKGDYPNDVNAEKT